jgi:hypothetical protein
VGVAVEIGKDELTGQKITTGGIVAAAIGGGLLGEGIVNAPETGGLSVIAAASARGGAEALGLNLIQQGTDMGTGEQKGFSVASAAISTGAGIVTGGASTMVGKTKWGGITSGKNSWAAKAKSAGTKVANGNQKSVPLSTLAKGAIAGQVGNAGNTFVKATGATAAAEVCTAHQTSC